MGRWNRRSAEPIWLEPEQLGAQRAARNFMEWWKPLLFGPLHRAGDLPEELTLAAAEMMMCMVDASEQRDLAGRVRRYRVARSHGSRCGELLEMPEALELASAEELGRGQELLGSVLGLLDRLIRPPPAAGPSGPGARPGPHSSRSRP